jgi:hypothetical protein
MTDKTAIQRIQELDRERAELFEQAKEEALRRATQAVDDLNALGLDYRLIVGPAPAGGKSPGKKPQETDVTDKKRQTRSPG